MTTLWPDATKYFAINDTRDFASLFEFTDDSVISFDKHFGMCSDTCLVNQRSTFPVFASSQLQVS